MIAPSIPSNEKERLEGLRRLAILDTATEDRFDRLILIAARLFDVPTVLISLVDEKRQWFKSCFGLDVREMDRSISFCGHAILGEGPFIVSDAKEDLRFSDNPLVVGAPYIRFYAGITLSTKDGLAVGTLCLIDQKPRTLAEKDLNLLKTLAQIVEDEINYLSGKQLTNLLRESDEQFTKAFEFAAIGMALVSPEGRFLRVNQSLCSLVGYTATELCTKSFQDITHSEDLEENLSHLRQILSGAVQSYRMEKRYFHKSGHVIWAELSVSLVRNATGQPLHFVSQIQDITIRKKAENELLWKTAFQEAILDSANHAIVSCAIDGTVTTFNKTAEQWLGYRAEEIVGKTSPAIWHDPVEIAARAGKLTSELGRKIVPGFEVFTVKIGPGKSEESEWTITRKDGTRFPGLLSASVITDTSGEIVGYLGVLSDTTERKRTQLALRASEERINLALESGQMGAWDLDLINNTSVRTLKHDQLFGYSSPLPEWNREKLLAHVFPEDRDFVLKRFEESLSSNYLQLECRIRWPDQSEHWIAVQGLLNRDDQGSPVRMSGVVTEITERKKAEESVRLAQREVLQLNDQLEVRVQERTLQLSESEKRFRFLAEAMPQIIWTARPDGSVDYFNQRWFNYTGMTMDETRDWGWTPVLHPDDLQSCLDQWKHACETGGKYDIKYRFKRASDGLYRWQLGRAFPLRDENGNITFWVGTCTDIDDLKRAEDAILKAKDELEKSELRFRSMADSIPQLSWVARADGFITWYNRRWYEYTGTVPKDMEGWGWQSVHHPGTLPRVMTSWTNSIASGEPFEMEFPLRGADGQFRAFLTRVVPLKDAAGGVLQWFGTNTDIDDLKRAEEVILKANEKLEKRVEERTKELHDRNIELQTAARAKNAFIANMSHELRTPLNGIIGFSEILVDGLAGEITTDQKEYIEDILNSGRHLLQLINDVLDLAKVEAGKMELHLEPFSLARAVEQVCSVAFPLLREKKIKLTTTIAPGTDEVMLDQKRFKQILYNLLSNAIKFTGERGQIEIVISPAAEECFTLAIRDSGIGIKPEGIARLFREFEQLDQGTTKRYEGTGLGLVLTRKIIELHGGSIQVESEFGKGSTFTAKLPMSVKETPSTTINLEEFPARASIK